jgi:hypothetical protein
MLRYTEEMEKAGFTRDQAEISVKVLIDVMNENFAAKSDIRELDLKLDSVAQRLESKVDSAIRELEYKMTIKLGTMMTLAIGVTATIVKLIQH